MNPFPILKNEWRDGRLGYGLSALLVAVTVSLGVAISAQERALRRASARAADPFPLVVGAAAGTLPLVLATVYLRPEPLTVVPMSTLETVRQEPGVTAASPLLFGDYVGSHPVVGTDATLMIALAGKHGPAGLPGGRIPARAGEALVGAAVAEPIGAALVSMHGAPVEGGEAGEGRAPHDATPYRVVGQLPRTGTPWDQAILVTADTLWSIHGMDADAGPVQAIVVQPRSVADAYRLRARFRAQGTTAVFPAEVLVELYQLLGDVGALVRVLSVCYQILAIAGVALALAALLNSRQRQFVLLRTMGAPRSYLALVAGLEVGSVLVLGMAAGCLLGWAGAQALAAVLGARLGLDVVLSFASEDALVLVPVSMAGFGAAAAAMAVTYKRSLGARLKAG
jgi:putative ABC transport system permease protein